MGMKFVAPLFLLMLTCACFLLDNGPLNGNHLQGLASVIRMSDVQQEILHSDYFQDYKIDKITSVSGFNIDYDTLKVVVQTNDESPALGIISYQINGFNYDIPVYRNQKKKLTFKYEDAKAKTVSIAGEMNNWSPQKLKKNKQGTWELSFVLADGKYQYQLVVDDKWMIDPSNKKKESNGIGGMNSVLVIGEKAILPFNPELISDESSFSVQKNERLKYGYVLWENHLIQAAEQEDALIYNIPEEASAMKRSHLRGYFVDDNDNIADFMIPLHYGKIIKDAAQLDRADKHSQVLYFTLIDRFCNGDTLIDLPLDDPEVHEKANYHGGDLAGILLKLREGYFKNLGINTLWLSPLTMNPDHAEVEYPAPHRKYSGYHGYWPVSCSRIDLRFGTSDDLQNVVNEAHNQGINVILDYVSNHVHEENPVYQNHKDWATELDLPDGTKNIRIWDEQRLTTWFDLFLPTLDFSKPEAVDLMTDHALNMLKNYDLDGFRHDATKHIPENYWRALTSKIKKDIAWPVFQIGETFGSRELIGSYVSSGMMDGQFDFNLYFDMRTVFASENSNFNKLHESMIASIKYYGNQSLMANITGNHDIPRFISYAGGALKFDEDEKAAGWDREIGVPNPIGYKKLNMLAAFLMTTPGIPVIYYGDEIGMPGAGDPDNRRPMKFDELTEDEEYVRSKIERLIKLRRSRMSLMYGSFELLQLSEDIYAYKRKYLDEQTIIIFNNSGVKNFVELENDRHMVPPYSYKIVLL